MNKKIILLVVLIINMATTLMAETESPQKVTLHSFEMIYIDNLWLHSSNPAALGFLGDLQPGIINLSYLNENGEFKRVQEGEKLNQFDFNTFSYAKTKKFNVYGSFNYSKGREEGLDFSNVNDPLRLTPYQLIDTIGNDNYDREFFSASGGFAVPLSDKFILGLSMNFNVGVAVQDRDPRPENKVFNTSVSPGIIYDMGNMKLGFNLIYKYYNEEIDVKIIQDDVDVTFFSTHGLGYPYPHKTDKYYRLQKSNTAGGAFQFEYNKGDLKTLFGSKILYYLDKNIDARKTSSANWAYEKKDSELKGLKINFFNYSKIIKANIIHYFGFDLALNSMIGTEIIQDIIDPEDIDDPDYWGTFAYEEKYDALNINVNAFYEHINLNENKERNFSYKFFANYHDFSQEYYIPMQKESFQNLKIGASYYKSFYGSKGTFTVGLGLAYKFNIDSEFDLSSYTFIAEKLLAPDYEYFKEDYYAPKFEMLMEFPMNKVFSQYFIKTSIEAYQVDVNNSRTIFSLSTGVTF